MSMKMKTGGSRKSQLADVYPEIFGADGQVNVTLLGGQADVMVLDDDSDQGSHPPTLTTSLNTPTFGTRKGAHQFQNGHESLNVTKGKHGEALTSVKESSDKQSNHKNDIKVEEEPLTLESSDKEDSGRAAGEEEGSFVPSVKYNFQNPLMALNYSGEFKTSKDNFTKGCKWSPDGSCLLVAANDSKMRLFNLPLPVQQGTFQCESWFTEEAEKYAVPAVTVIEKELVYDYSWYPLMRSDSPNTCCFVTTCRDQPIHLWDAWRGHLICSYRSFNHLDEMVAAYSVGFNLDGSRMVAGFKKCLRTFHTVRPGRYFEQIDAKEQPGIISCTSFNPQLPEVFAAGSYLGSIGLYNLERNNLFCRIDGDMGGVTQLQFSSCGTKLFSGSRKNNEILCWDIRNPGTVLCGYKRQVSTSQRIYFDLETYSSSFLVSASTLTAPSLPQAQDSDTFLSLLQNLI